MWPRTPRKATDPTPGSAAEQAGGDVHEHARRYEQARQVATGGGADGWRHGLGVLAARGVAAWMATWAALTPAGARPRTGTTEQAEPSPATDPREGGAQSTGSACTSFPPPAAAAVVAVLAQMTLAHARSPA